MPFPNTDNDTMKELYDTHIGAFVGDESVDDGVPEDLRDDRDVGNTQQGTDQSDQEAPRTAEGQQGQTDDASVPGDGSAAGKPAADGDRKQSEQSGDTKDKTEVDKKAQDPQQQQPQQQQEDGQPRIVRDRHGQLVDRKGNIYNESGHIIAAAGRERTLYTQARVARAQVTELEKQLQDATMENTRGFNALAQVHQLSAEEVAAAAQYAGSFKRDPIGTVAHLARGLLQAGYDIIGAITGNPTPGKQPYTPPVQNVGAAVADAVKADRVQQQQQQEAEARQREAEGKRAYNEFVSANPHALVHEETIVELMNTARSRGMTLTPQQALQHIEQYVHTNGLDLYQPLNAQVRATPTQQPPAPPAKQQVGNGTQAREAPKQPLDSAGMSPGQPMRDVPTLKGMLDGYGDYNASIAAAMDESGL